MTERYDCIIVDTVNLAYKTFIHKSEIPETILKKKAVYKESICNFIRCIENLKEKYAYKDSDVYFLVDNYFSRADLQSSFAFATRKEICESYKKARSKESKEFYNSINCLMYYYMIGPSNYHVCRIERLEADDLVRPLIELEGLANKRCLMVTSDLDWCRYLTMNIHWLPKLNGETENSEQLKLKMGFDVSEKNIVLYKAVFGDTSDNIPQVARETESHRKQLIELMDNVDYPENLVMLARDSSNYRKYPLLRILNENERQFTINLQLVSTIPCDIAFVKEALKHGANDTTLYKVLREAIGLDIPDNKFTFGHIKRPRV